MTKLYTEIIYGPVHSRRLGVSLGVNLLPLHSKLCSFDCIYCECGWNAERRGTASFNPRETVAEALEVQLQKMASEGVLPDVITFAGNGEPTMHPDFEEVINDTLRLRDNYAPQAKVSVLSNATQLHRESVCRALRRVDNNILKLDSAFDATVKAINKPCGAYRVADVVERIASFEGDCIVQTMFLRGECDGCKIDNTTDEEVEAWLKLVQHIAPRSVMVYSIDRDTPCRTLEKVPREELQSIAAKVEKLGIPCSVA